MATQAYRSRSTVSASTTSNTRPLSRQSTTSVRSNPPPSVPSYRPSTEPTFQVQPQPHSQDAGPSPEEMIRRSSHQLTGQPNSYPIDPALQNNLQQGAPYKMSNAQTQGNDEKPALSPYEPSEQRQSQAPEAATEVQENDETAPDGSRRKKGAASTLANDNELRRLFRENEGKDLTDLAAQVLEKKSEKTKQIFGMLWLSKYCKRTSGSVPRNRVFSLYNIRCGNERVPPLNPASFGKLVRIIFPSIATRRLGVRGESKYHYVDLSLTNEDENESMNGLRSHSVGTNAFAQLAEESSFQQSQRPFHPADPVPAFPSVGTSPEMQFPPPGPRLVKPSTSSSMQLYLLAGRTNQNRQPQRIYRPLKFPTASYFPPADDPIQLPSIEPYLPAGTDPDAVKSLTSVYRGHCLLAIDNFRFCKSTEFFESFKSFCGLLTAPGLKLFQHPNIVPWIQHCDWLKYQKMMPVLEGTILSQVPPKVMTHMENIRIHLCDRIGEAFQNQPQHVQDAMFGPATIFTNLLQRMVRVHRAALDVAGTLDVDANRDHLWRDWVDHSDVYQVVQNTLTDKGFNRVLHILTRDVRELLSPLNERLATGASTIFDYSADFHPGIHSHPNMDTSHSFVDRLAQFLNSLPLRFPAITARQLLDYIDVIGNSISRNFSLGGAESLASWWRIKVFIDEMSYWLAEEGGFLESGPESMMIPAPQHTSIIYQSNFQTAYDFRHEDPNDAFGISRPRTAGSVSMANPSRFDSEEQSMNDFRPPRSRGHDVQQPATGRHTTPSDTIRVASSPVRPLNTHPSSKINHSHRESRGIDRHASSNPFGENNVMDNDDSGIGMGTEDDDFGMEKYNGFVEGIHGSDPADVVVC